VHAYSENADGGTYRTLAAAMFHGGGIAYAYRYAAGELSAAVAEIVSLDADELPPEGEWRAWDADHAPAGARYWARPMVAARS
jgi:hypothetical protein